MRRVLLAFISLFCVSSSICARADHAEGYLGLEIIGNRVDYTRRFTPAEKSGLRPGDEILAIDAKPVDRLGRDAIFAILRGAVGDRVTISARRGVKDFVVVMATRESYPFPPTLTSSAEECYKLGIKQRELGFPNEARVSLKKAVELDPKGLFGIKAERYIRTELPLNSIPTEALTLNNRAWNLVRSEHVSEAKALLEKCVSLYPDFEWPRNHLSGIYSSEGKLREANELIDHTLSINPQYVSAWLARSDLRCAEHDMKGAILCARKAVELDPDNKSAKQRLNELMGTKNK
jgi:hypothetical protein